MLGREQTTLYMPQELKAALQEEAEMRGMGVNEILLIIFSDFICHWEELNHVLFRTRKYAEE
jgi:hypothetical protein